jgi:hypothetical protein
MALSAIVTLCVETVIVIFTEGNKLIIMKPKTIRNIFPVENPPQ